MFYFIFIYKNHCCLVCPVTYITNFHYQAELKLALRDGNLTHCLYAHTLL